MKKEFFSKWVPFIRELDVSTVLKEVSEKYVSSYKSVRDEKLRIPTKFSNNESFGIIVSSKSKALLHQKLVYKVSLSKAALFFLSRSHKSVGTGRKVKYPEKEAFIVDLAMRLWETGNLATRAMIYDTMIHKFGHKDEEKRDEFEKVINIYSGNITPVFSGWISRALKRNDRSVKRESISQSVSMDWFEISVEDYHIIQKTMKKAGVTRLVNADESFLNYYPKENHMIT